MGSPEGGPEDGGEGGAQQAPICSVSVDLDPLRCYYEIHGLGTPPPELRDVVLRRGLRRFIDLFARRQMAATFFVVGEDLDVASPSGTPAGRALLREAAAAGHELANHSHTHPYRLVRFGPGEVTAEIDRAGTLLAEVAGTAPVGFRSPGYNLSPTVIAELVARGYRYDSSILPAPLYYAAKAAVMGSMRLTGRTSRSTLGDPRFLFAPTTPYRPDARAPWRRGNAPIVELPITVTPGLRLWIIGTSLLIAPLMLRDHLVATAAKARFFNLEMHRRISLLSELFWGIINFVYNLYVFSPLVQLSLACISFTEFF